MSVWIAHVGEIVGGDMVTTSALSAVALIVAVLTLEHLHVKHDGLRVRHVVRAIAGVIVVALASIAAPLPGVAQDDSEPRGLPDLVSDPPRNVGTRNVQHPGTGEIIRVLTFDGFLHNIGTGKLEISGNPQIEGGMQQRVFNGQDWDSVGTPTVRFENDDGHNHFHFMRAADYALWSDDRSQQITDAAKIGFCLVDTQQMEEGHDSNYLIGDFNYCGVDDPDTVELTMGITPGWRDTYDSNVSLQWVDISNVRPGMYWTSAQIDPNNEIVESNEDNNGLVFSENRFAVDGYVARELGQQRATEPIQLKSQVFGITGTRAFVITEGPTNGSLDVPVGFDLVDVDTVHYTPDPGFAGTDSFSYYAHDVATSFPYDPVVVDVTIDADGALANTRSSASDNPDTLEIVDPGLQVGTHYERTELALEIDGPAAAAQDARWYGKDLPQGLTIDRQTGVIKGALSFIGDYQSTVILWRRGQVTTQEIDWSIVDQAPPTFIETPPFSAPGGQLLRMQVGAGTPGATYRGSGLPDGGSVVPNVPMLTGIAREVGTFTVLIEELIDDEVTETLEVEWTVRPSIRPAFPL